jgi:8-oxo-dGTP pyrophosphatase MutT (NUDIX family)
MTRAAPLPRECDEAEDALAAAKRELWEETGIVVAREFVELGTFKQANWKTDFGQRSFSARCRLRRAKHACSGQFRACRPFC